MASAVQLRVQLLDYSSINPLLVEDSSLKADKESSKIGWLCFGGVTRPVLIIQESYTWPHLEHRKRPLNPNGIILQMAALSLSLYHCRAKSI